MQTRTLLLLALLLTLLAYAPGLAGPFLLDDMANLAQIASWLAGHSNFHEAIWGTSSGLFHRPVAMFSLALDGSLAGLRPSHFKLINLVIHIGTGFAVWLFCRRMLRIALDESQASIAAIAIAAIWMLHPLNVSTTLYVVQRMAQLTALFSLLALVAYIDARLAWLRGERRRGIVLLFGLVPLLFALALGSKENAVVLPALCALVEMTLFQGRNGDRRPLLAFFGLFLVLPALAALTFLAFGSSDRLLGGYEFRDFTLVERLMTQCRVLVDYMQQLVLPQPGRMGLYHDAYPVSRGLLEPVSTAISLAILTLVSVAAAWMRRRAPLIFFGWFFFLVAHSVESGIFPLELYFEHRNYLPAVGLWLMLAGIACHLRPRWEPLVARAPRVPLVALFLVIGTFGLMTASKAMTWRSAEKIAAQGVEHHPHSLRAALMLATAMLEQGRLPETRAALERLLSAPSAESRLIARLGLATTDCLEHGNVPMQRMHDIRAALMPTVTLNSMQGWSLLARATKARQCGGLPPSRLAMMLEDALDRAGTQPETSGPKWKLRLLAALTRSEAGDIDGLVRHARLAWTPAADLAVGSVLIEGLVAQGDLESAEQVFAELEARIGKREKLGLDLVRSTRTLIDQARSNAAPSGSPE